MSIENVGYEDAKIDLKVNLKGNIVNIMLDSPDSELNLEITLEELVIIGEIAKELMREREE